MEIVKGKTVAFTGHRTLTTPDVIPDANLENVIRTELYCLIRDYYEDGYTNYLSGMAVGFDMLSAEVVLEFRKSHPDVRLYAVISFQGHELHYSHKINYATNISTTVQTSEYIFPIPTPTIMTT